MLGCTNVICHVSHGRWKALVALLSRRCAAAPLWLRPILGAGRCPLPRPGMQTLQAGVVDGRWLYQRGLGHVVDNWMYQRGRPGPDGACCAMGRWTEGWRQQRTRWDAVGSTLLGSPVCCWRRPCPVLLQLLPLACGQGRCGVPWTGCRLGFGPEGPAPYQRSPAGAETSRPLAHAALKGRLGHLCVACLMRAVQMRTEPGALGPGM